MPIYVELEPNKTRKCEDQEPNQNPVSGFLLVRQICRLANIHI